MVCWSRRRQKLFSKSHSQAQSGREPDLIRLADAGLAGEAGLPGARLPWARLFSLGAPALALRVAVGLARSSQLRAPSLLLSSFPPPLFFARHAPPSHTLHPRSAPRRHHNHSICVCIILVDNCRRATGSLTTNLRQRLYSPERRAADIHLNILSSPFLASMPPCL